MIQRLFDSPPPEKSALERLGLSKEPSQGASVLRAILKGVKEGAADELKKLPGGSIALGVVESLLELSGDDSGQQTERRLEEILDLGKQSKDELDALKALAMIVFLRQESLLAHLQTAGQATERKQLTDFALGAALVAYRSSVVNEYRHSDQRGIEGLTRGEHTFSPLLDETYVLPRLLSETAQTGLRDRERLLLNDLLDDRPLPREMRISLEEEYGLISGERWRGLKAIVGESKADPGVSIGEMFKSARHAVIIGGPGVGKSALTRFLAFKCAEGADAMKERFDYAEELTPVVVSLARFADARMRHQCSTLREFIDRLMFDRGGEALQWMTAEVKLCSG